jgi:hypothetical protein
MDPRFKHPFTVTVTGPSGSSKTLFTFKLIEEASRIIYPLLEKTVYCYGAFQPIFNEYTNITFNEGLPDIGQFYGNQPTYLIVDDLSSEIND